MTTFSPDFSPADFNIADFPVERTYDLSGLATLTATLDQMLADQTSGAVNFAGSAETWIPFPTGWFLAVLTTGANPSPFTAERARNWLKTIRAFFDVLAGGNAAASVQVIQTITPGTWLLETGRSPTGPNKAYGPIMNGASFVANTDYDLSGLSTLKASAEAMIADFISGAASFTGWGETWVRNPKGVFFAVMSPGATPQAVTFGNVLPLMNELRRKLDLVGTTRRFPTVLIAETGQILTGEGGGPVLSAG